MTSGHVASASFDAPAGSSGAEGRILGLFTPWGAGVTLAVAGGIVALFYRWLLKQHEFSANNLEDWGHAYLIPLISGYMVWQHREEIARERFGVFWPGVLPLVLGIATYVYFNIFVPNHMLSGGAFVLTLLGVVMTLLGPRSMRYFFLPVAFLTLGVTISTKIMLTLTFALQLVASEGAHVVLVALSPLLGYETELAGNTITMVDASGNEHPMNVAEACSGMRMVIAFIALAAAVALLGSQAWWQRVAVVLLAVPVAVIMNVFRVAVLGLLTLVDADLAAGDAHTMIGTLLLIPSLGVFMGVIWALNRIFREGGAPEGGAGS